MDTVGVFDLPATTYSLDLDAVRVWDLTALDLDAALATGTQELAVGGSEASLNVRRAKATGALARGGSPSTSGCPPMPPIPPAARAA